VPDGWTSVRLVAASPSGDIFIVHDADGALGVLREGRWPWDTPSVVEVSPKPARRSLAPFAFSHDEDRLAVPAGPTGIRIYDLSDLRTLSLLPTPSRVTALEFRGKMLISVDGSNENAIPRVQP